MSAYVGQPLERIEDERLLRGEAAFVDDIAFKDMVYLAVLRSPAAHGRIARLDLGAARTMDGVVCALAAKEFASLPKIPLRLAPLEGVERFLQDPIAREKVRFVGEPVAVVVATSPELAEDALERIELEIEPLPAVVDWKTASEPAALLFEKAATNIATTYVVASGDPEVFSSAPYRRREQLSCQRQTAMPMETRGLVASWDPDRELLSIWGSSKVLWFNRKIIAESLDLPIERVRMMETDIGGSFGVRGELHPEDLLVPFVSKVLARPVKWIEDRREHLMATNHSREISCDLEIACARDGHILGLRAHVHADMGAYTRTNGGVVPSRAAQFLVGPYRIPATEFHVTLFQTNKTPVGTYRGPGRFEGSFFRERIFDIAAAELHIDPAAFRRINLIREDELPYSIGKLVPYEKPFVYDTGDYLAGLEDVLDHIGYDRLVELNGRDIAGKRHGVGLCCYVEPSGAGPQENSRLVLEDDGRISIYTGGVGVGQGLRTALAQIAADALGVHFQSVIVPNASTENLSEGFGTFASRSTIKGGSAILEGAKNFIDTLVRFAAQVHGRPVNDLQWQRGAIRTHDGTIIFDLPQLAREANRRETRIEALGSFSDPSITFSYGAHAAHVAVDTRTGVVDVLDYYATEDVGLPVNPNIVHGQMIGAIVQGLGGVFLDHIVYDANGQILTGTLADYLVPLASDFPVVRGETYGKKRATSNPLGVKGAGEGGIVGVGAAVANAVAAALAPMGAHIVALPLSPVSVWQAIKNAEER